MLIHLILNSSSLIHLLYLGRCGWDGRLLSSKGFLFLNLFVWIILLLAMQSYNMESREEEDNNDDYKQDLGLKKMLYKYQNQNEQLKNQIKALTERLDQIMSSKEQQQSAPVQEPMSAHDKFWNDQMSFYYKEIEKLKSEIKANKQLINEAKEQEFNIKHNLLKDKEKKLALLKSKLEKYQKEDNERGQEVHQSKVTVQNDKPQEVSEEEFENKLLDELDQLRKRIRELERTRNNNHRHDLSRHREIVNLNEKTRKIQSQGINYKQKHSIIDDRSHSPKKGGLWGMELTQENYFKVKQELDQLKKEKNVLLQSIKMQNSHLRQRVSALKNEYIDISTHSIDNISSLNLSNATSPKHSKQLAILSTPKKYPEKEFKQTIILPDIPLGNSAYERKNDKNYVQKQVRMIEWSGSAKNKIKRISSGLNWNDESKKSPITGINLWIDKYLIGIQFIHTMGESTQHIHIEGNDGKKLVPIQYRLSGNDYLENVVLAINNGTYSKSEVPVNSITGIELVSKNGRKDHFGQKIGSQGNDRFAFNIKAPEKPIYSIGSFTIDPITKTSCISKLGFAVI